MIVARILALQSKLATARGLGPDTASTSLGAVLHVEAADADALYSAMDWLLRRQPRIEVPSRPGIWLRARSSCATSPRRISKGVPVRWRSLATAATGKRVRCRLWWGWCVTRRAAWSLSRCS